MKREICSPPPRAVIYHRVSTDEQRADGARAMLSAELERQRFACLETIEEVGSGASNDRPGLLRVLELARARAIDVVLVQSLDRFGRSALDLLRNIEILQQHGVQFIAVGQGLNFYPDADPVSQLLLTLLAAVAEFERDLIRSRTRAGLRRARADGTTLGRPRCPRPARAAVAALRATGHSWREVSSRLGCSVWAARTALAENGADR